MRPSFTPNITTTGRVVRGLIALKLLVGAAFGFTISLWLGVLLAASGAFLCFEALRGWCALRACGIRTRL